MISSSLMPTSSSSSANSARRFHQVPSFYQFRISTLLQSVPLLFSVSASPNATEEAQVLKLLEDILTQLYVHIHGNQKNLQYWIAIAEDSDPTYHGVHFKVREAIPVTQGGVLNLETELTSKQVSSENSSKIDILKSVRYHLIIFGSKVHKEMMKLKSSPKNLLELIATVDGYISGLKDSVYSIEGIADLGPFTFDNRMSDETPTDAVDRIYRNVIKMDSYLSSLVATYRKPSKIPQKVMLVGVVAIAAVTLSVLVFNQSGPLGIIDNTVAAIKDFVIGHVKEPLANLKDELFNKSMKRAMELKEVEELGFNKEMLRSMLQEFIERTTDDRSYANKSNEEILELVAKRYAQQIKSPICGIIKGNLVETGLIQVQKLKVDLLTEKLLVNKIMRENGLSFAIAAASPTIGVFSLGALVIYQLVKRSERKGRWARRHLLLQIERRLNELQNQGEHDEYLHGLLLYTADRLSKAVEKSANATHEWNSVREELANLGVKQGNEQYKILSRLEGKYACLLP